MTPDPPKQNPALRADIIKIIIDKLFIGLVLVIIGLLASRYLETFKSNESFRSELNKKKVEKISEVWEKVFLWDAAARRASSVFDDVGFIDPDDPKALAEAKKRFDKAVGPISLDALRQDVDSVSNKNRLWLDDDEYEAIGRYLELVSESLAESMGRFDRDVNISVKEELAADKAYKEKAASLRVRINETRQTLNKLREKLFKEPSVYEMFWPQNSKVIQTAPAKASTGTR